MDRFLEQAIKEKMCSTVEGTAFYIHMNRNGQSTGEAQKRISEAIAESGMSVTEAIGLLEYMKIVVCANSCPQIR